MVDSQRVSDVVNSIKKKYSKERPSYEKSEKVAAELISKLKISSYPVPIVAILKNLGFKIYVANMPSPNVSGFILIDPDLKPIYRTDKVIAVSKYDHISRQRFILAHELGHFFV